MSRYQMFKCDLCGIEYRPSDSCFRGRKSYQVAYNFRGSGDIERIDVCGECYDKIVDPFLETIKNLKSENNIQSQ